MVIQKLLSILSLLPVMMVEEEIKFITRYRDHGPTGLEQSAQHLYQGYSNFRLNTAKKKHDKVLEEKMEGFNHSYVDCIATQILQPNCCMSLHSMYK